MEMNIFSRLIAVEVKSIAMAIANGMGMGLSGIIHNLLFDILRLHIFLCVYNIELFASARKWIHRRRLDNSGDVAVWHILWCSQIRHLTFKMQKRGRCYLIRHRRNIAQNYPFGIAVTLQLI